MIDKPYVPLERLDEFRKKILKMWAEEERLRALNAEKGGAFLIMETSNA